MKKITFLAAIALLAAVGCSSQPAGQSNTSGGNASADGSKYLLDAEPQGAKSVIEVREGAKEGDDVLIVGRIGGSKNPWIDGRAAFVIVDPSLNACSDIPGDACPIPWDYCCETERLPESTALVEVVDDQGNLVKTGAKELLNVKELSTVVVKGKAKRDDDGNLTILAIAIFVKS